MTTAEREPISWWRRPRPPLTGFLAVDDFYGTTGRFSAFLGLGVAWLWGLGASAAAWPWWGRAIASIVAVASFSGIVVLAVYLHRPVSEELRYDVAEDWAHDLERHGRVDLGVRPVAAVTMVVFGVCFIGLGGTMVVIGDSLLTKALGIVCVIMFLLLGLLPHLEFATGRGPGLRVDTGGITIARWVPLTIPWSEVIGVRTSGRMHAVVYTTDRFIADYEASRPFLLKVTGGGPGLIDSSGFAIPSTISANPDALSSWLTYEANQRRPQHTA